MITVPVLATVIVYSVGWKMYGHKWKAIHAAVNWTTLLYIIAAVIMFKMNFGRSFAGTVVLILLTIFTAIVVIQWKVSTEVTFSNVFNVFWCICFLLFVLLNCLLALTGIMFHML